MGIVDEGVFDGSCVVVSGATGLIGGRICRSLVERNRSAGADIRVIALVRDVARARNGALGQWGEADGLSVVECDLSDAASLVDATVDGEEFGADWIVHAACPTASSAFVSRPASVFWTIVSTTRGMLELAGACGAEGIVCLSSMEVYGAGNARRGTDHLLREDEVGVHDPANPRSCYPLGKIAAEHLCHAWAVEQGVPAKVVRLAQTFGLGVSPGDGRLFMQLARAARAGEDAVLATTGGSTRMYLHTDDAVEAVLCMLARGGAGGCANAANPQTYCSVLEMAEMVMERFGADGARVRVEVDENAPYPSEHHLPLDVSRLMALGWQPTHGLEEMYAQVIAELGDGAAG